MKNRFRQIISLLGIAVVTCLMATQLWAAPKLII